MIITLKAEIDGRTLIMQSNFNENTNFETLQNSITNDLQKFLKGIDSQFFDVIEIPIADPNFSS